MNPRDNVIAHLFADYSAWCKSQGIPPDPWEDFFNTLKDYDEPTLNQIRDNYQGKNRITLEDLEAWINHNVYHPILSALDHYQTPFIRLPDPIQPNDEERAVAEVMRMLGGEG